MHLGTEAITAECAVVTLGAAAAGLGLAAAAIRHQPVTSQKLALAMGLGTLVFAAQAVNVTVLPGSSAHLVGGVLLAWTLGPALGAWTMAAILLLQAVLLGDGSLSAWGANVLNMGLIPAGLVAGCQRALAQRGVTHQRGLVLPAGLAGIAVVLAAGLIVLETAAFRSPTELTTWTGFASRMLSAHLWIGALESLATLALLYALGQLSLGSQRAAIWRPALAAAVSGLVLIAIAVPFASSLPDGYEAAALAGGMDRLLSGETSRALLSGMNQQAGLLLATACAATSVGLIGLAAQGLQRLATAKARK